MQGAVMMQTLDGARWGRGAGLAGDGGDRRGEATSAEGPAPGQAEPKIENQFYFMRTL
jgi:hypothetical protein